MSPLDLTIQQETPTPTNPSLVFKVADDEDEFAKIHRLNYSIFVEEIPQHTANDQRMLIDAFHHENTYYRVRHTGQ